MPVLENIKRERFAYAVASGASQAEAFKSAGFRSKHVNSSASRLAAVLEVQARIKELTTRNEKRALDAVVRQTAIDKEWVIRKLRDNLERAEGVRGGSAVANRALELLGKHLGMFQDLPPAGPPRLEDLSTEDLERMLGREPGSTIAAARNGSLASPSPVSQFEESPVSRDGSKSTQ